ncbi:hypothetical protein [Paenibacillus sp. NAIST15-1]|uniref:hypothetical protein n=1 Tax=Paenibacillus sp. NAIST15-1 TaxID=1605994 RepID=UPI00086BE311|nr:hypothetical protein [Paenibacillus sp. NAIST15-1]GAV11334.1 hypothetical protein PBN151_1261 [Paenibacillus sp. NAIST15-1]
MNIHIPIDWGSYIISIPLILATVWAGLRFLAKKYVEQEFSKRIENHKHDLNLLVEANKFDIQRKMYDFNLYTTKRHETYMKLYNLFLEASSRVSRFQGIRQIPDFKNFSNEVIAEYLRRFNLSESEWLTIAENWNNGTDPYLVKKVESYYNINEVREMEAAYVKAKNEYLLTRLYLSKKVESICLILSSKLTEALLELEEIYDINYIEQDINLTESRKNLRKIHDDINLHSLELKDEMQKELSIGYYDNTK